MAGKVTTSQFAEQVGVTGSAIRKAIAAGRLTADADGLLDPVAALAQWQHNRRRQRRRSAKGPVQAPTGFDEGADYWRSRARREAAQADIAEQTAAELRGHLVRLDAAKRELAGQVVPLREALRNLPARLAPVLAGEPDAATCERLLRAEIHQALDDFFGALPAPSPGEDPK